MLLQKLGVVEKAFAVPPCLSHREGKDDQSANKLWLPNAKLTSEDLHYFVPIKILLYFCIFCSNVTQWFGSFSVWFTLWWSNFRLFVKVIFYFFVRWGMCICLHAADHCRGLWTIKKYSQAAHRSFYFFPQTSQRNLMEIELVVLSQYIQAHRSNIRWQV